MFRVGMILVCLCLALVRTGAVNPNCALIVPANPLSATGLSTPYYLQALDSNAGPCNQINPDQSSFVQGAIFNLDTNTISVYNPLVIDAGTTPKTAPVVPQLPSKYVAALWFGTNADTLTLLNTRNTNSLVQGVCVNGGGNAAYSIFGQFSYCNAPAFFAAVNNALDKGLLSVPRLGFGSDGLICPTVRDYSVVDQDQSDNVVTQQLQIGTTIVQDTQANRNKYPNAAVVGNGSDNRLLVDFILPALGCRPWIVQDLADPNNPKNTLPLNEIQASLFQQFPVARVPGGDPMVLTADGQPDVNKLNLYRVGVNMLPVNSVDSSTANTKFYCLHMLQTGAPRILRDRQFTKNFASPDPANAGNLFDFLVMRFQQSLVELNCLSLLGLNVSPLDVTGNSTSTTNPLDVFVNQAISDQIASIPTDPEDIYVPDFRFQSTMMSAATSLSCLYLALPASLIVILHAVIAFISI